MQTLLTAATLAAVIVAAATGVHNASNRRAEYIDAELAYFECIDSGLSRAECVTGVF